MPQNFLTCDRDQQVLLPPDLRDWLDDDHLAWFVIDAVAELDLEPFYAAYRADGHGRAAHDPQMMVTLFAYAYAVGERSSRGIERRCREDVAFRVICANQVPDHATIARFRVRHEDALAELFGQVLGLCGKAGIVDVGVIALDGTKLAANASDGAIRTYEQIATEIVAEAGRIDAAEDEVHGDARGDELPEGLRSANGRRAWLRQAKEELERERAERPEPVPRDRAARLETCRRRLNEDWRTERRANQRYEAYRARGVMKDGRPFGTPPKPYTPPEAPEGNQHHRPRRAADEVRPQLHARLQRPGGHHLRADHRRRRDHHQGRRFRGARPDDRRRRARVGNRWRRGEPRSRPRGRRLLVERAHRLASQAGHRPDRRRRHHSKQTAKEPDRRDL
jgi:transposase